MLEMRVNKKNDDVFEVLLNQKNDDLDGLSEACEHFAYRKTLLFYTQECKYCRYARMVKEKGGKERECICTYAAQMLQDTVG